MLEIHCIKNARNSKSTFDLRLAYMDLNAWFRLLLFSNFFYCDVFPVKIYIKF